MMNITHGAIGLIKSIFGIDIITSQKQFERMKICSICENFSKRRCNVCGCYLVHKTRLKSEHCPKNKW